MKLDNFTASDICKIIDKCAKSGVTELQFGDQFCVSFGKVSQLPESSPGEAIQDQRGDFPQVEETKVEKVSDEALILERSGDAEEETANLLLTNPDEYEELMARGELETDGTQKEEPSGPQQTYS